MSFMVRQWAQRAKFTDALALEALEQVLPHALIQTAATEADQPTQRRRKLPADVTLLLCVAMSLFTHEALAVVLAKMAHGVRLFWADPDIALATKSAISQARYRLGARPVVALFHRLCQPLATPQTPGAFFGGLRLVALDGPVEDVPDSPARCGPSGATTVTGARVPFPVQALLQ